MLIGLTQGVHILFKCIKTFSFCWPMGDREGKLPSTCNLPLHFSMLSLASKPSAVGADLTLEDPSTGLNNLKTIPGISLLVGGLADFEFNSRLHLRSPFRKKVLELLG